MLKDANQAKSAAAASTSMPGTRSKDRKAFLERVVPKAKPAPSSPRHADADKRHGGKTGETPDGKKSPDTKPVAMCRQKNSSNAMASESARVVRNAFAVAPRKHRKSPVL